MMNVRDVMTTEVLTVAPDASVLQAARLMLQNEISGLPVVDDRGNLVGMLTEGDFLRRSEIDTEHKASRWIEFLMGPGLLAEAYVHAYGRKVAEVMTKELQTVSPDTSLYHAVDLMERYHVKRLPVMSEDKLIGLVTRTDLMRAVVAKAVKNHAAKLNDESIKQRLLDELKKQSWAPFTVVDISVKDGVLKYSGCITDERERQAVRVAAENISGVTAIEDNLVWVEPISGMAIEGPGKTS